MTGLEKILNQISADAKTMADDIVSEGSAKAEKIIQSAKTEAEKQSELVLAGGKNKAAEAKERAGSAALLKKRNKMLAFKQDYIKDLIDSLCTEMENAAADEYFDNLILLVSAYAKTDKGIMSLNENDLKRLPPDFGARVNAAAGYNITISDTPCNIKGGFLLVYEGIDVNCSFKAIFEDKADSLNDIAGRMLFPG